MQVKRPAFDAGTVIGALHQRHREVEFRTFLKRIDQQVPPQLAVRPMLRSAELTTRGYGARHSPLRAHPER